MDNETRITNLEKRVNYLYDLVNRNQFYSNADMNSARQNISNITPFTETKTAYIDDTSVLFINVPQGNLTVFCPVDYTVERIGNTVTVSFEPLSEVTDITIMIQ